MSNIAIVTDSNSGITQAEGKRLGISVLPMPFMINGQTFFEDIDLTQEEFYEKLATGAEISTSQPSPESVLELWERLLEEYDEVVHIPMSSGLSGSCQSAIMLAEEYDGRVQVVNNQRISVTQRQSCLDAKRLAAEGKNACKIREILETDKFNSSIYIMLDTLYYLKKGGRITPAAAAIGTMLRLKPVLQIQGEKLDAFAKARTTAQGKNIMMTAIRNDMENRFGGAPDPKTHWISMAYTCDREAGEAFRDEVRAAFPGFDIPMDPLSLSVACHIGPGALAVTCSRKLETWIDS
ncbi:MAG: DegV family protein [Roseburia sp.]|nr:DegV family protein [Roseburia sp.]MCM1098833.1 DegV family protein [Ruminococcus flavefaciens]